MVCTVDHPPSDLAMHPYFLEFGSGVVQNRSTVVNVFLSGVYLCMTNRQLLWRGALEARGRSGRRRGRRGVPAARAHALSARVDTVLGGHIAC